MGRIFFFQNISAFRTLGCVLRKGDILNMLHRKLLTAVGTYPQAECAVAGNSNPHNGRSRNKKTDNACQNAIFYICDYRNKYNQKDDPYRKEKKQIFCKGFAGIPISGITLFLFGFRKPDLRPQIVRVFHISFLF